MQEGANQKCLPFTILYKEEYIILESLKPSNIFKVLKKRQQAFSDVIISHFDIPVQSGVFYCSKETLIAVRKLRS